RPCGSSSGVARSPPASASGSRRIRSDTPSRRISSAAVRTSVSSRRSSATPTSARRRSTRTSRPGGCARSTGSSIPERDEMKHSLTAAGLLVLSNVFMTIAWYGHLRFRALPLWTAILASWGIAFFEYTMQVPANRIGYRALSGYQLKVMQEAITLVVFMVFAAFWLGEGVQVRYLISFGLIMAAVFVAFPLR